MKYKNDSSLADALCRDKNPVVAYRARRLLAMEPPTSTSMRRLRQRIADSEMARRLLTPQHGKPLDPYIKWQGPHWTLYCLAEIAFPPGQRELLPMRNRQLDWLLRTDSLRSRRKGTTEDQTERPRRHASMEGNAIWSQLVLGIVDQHRTPELVKRLVGSQWPDGGWNCDKRDPARTSSVQETLIPLRALALWDKTVDDDAVGCAIRRACEFLLDRELLWRRSNRQLIVPDWGGPVDRIHYPIRFYDVLSALLVMSEIGLVDDDRCKRALDLLESKRLPTRMFPVEWSNVTTTDQTRSRGTYANWGPRGRTHGNPFVSIDALHVLATAGRTSL